MARSYRFKQGSGLPVRVPVIEMVEIGMGVSRSAGMDDLERIHVGPESAGSELGPAAYGRGGRAGSRAGRGGAAREGRRGGAAGTPDRDGDAGGRGAGDPRRRARDRVREDVLHGYVTVDAAARDYGLKEDS